MNLGVQSRNVYTGSEVIDRYTFNYVVDVPWKTQNRVYSTANLFYMLPKCKACRCNASKERKRLGAITIPIDRILGGNITTVKLSRKYLNREGTRSLLQWVLQNVCNHKRRVIVKAKPHVKKPKIVVESDSESSSDDSDSSDSDSEDDSDLSSSSSEDDIDDIQRIDKIDDERSASEDETDEEFENSEESEDELLNTTLNDRLLGKRSINSVDIPYKKRRFKL